MLVLDSSKFGNNKKAKMKNPELYNRTVDILVQAYFNDTLQHGNCHACAVGNLVAANCGYSFIKYSDRQRWEKSSPYWQEVHMVGSCGTQWIAPDWYHNGAKHQIDSTGYKWEETAKIELAFETAPKGNSEDEWMFNGLMAVIDVLDEIHENTDKQVTQLSKSKFNKNLQTVYQ